MKKNLIFKEKFVIAYHLEDLSELIWKKLINFRKNNFQNL